MKKVLTVLIIFTGFYLSACSENPVSSLIDTNKLEGTWKFEKVDDKNNYIYAKVVNLEKDDQGFNFRDKNKLIARTSSGRCGTPPLVLNNYSGTWFKPDQNHIVIKYETEIGCNSNFCEIVKIENGELILSYINTNQ